MALYMKISGVFQTVVFCIVLLVNSQTCPDPVCSCSDSKLGTTVLCRDGEITKHLIKYFPRNTSVLELHNTVADHETLVELFRKTKKIKKLLLSDTKLTKLTRQLFTNLHEIEELQLKKCFDIVTIDDDTFSNFFKLRVLVISNNENVPFVHMRNALRKLPTKHLESFALFKQGIRTTVDRPVLNRYFIDIFRNKPLRKFIISSNLLSSIEPGYYKILQNVTCSIVHGNLITRTWAAMFELFLMENLVIYDVSYQGGSHGINDDIDINNLCIKPLPPSVDDTVSNDTIEATWKLIDRSCTVVFGLPPKLQFAYIHNLHIGLIRDPFTTKCFNPDNQLRYIDAYNTKVDYVKPSIGLVRLQYFNIQNSLLSFITYHSFAYFPSLRTLLLGGNQVGRHFLKGNATAALRNLPKLSSLDLANNDISYISKTDLQFLLTIKHLNLSQNSIRIDTLDGNYDITTKMLNLSRNSLSNLPIPFRKAIVRSPNSKIDILKNPLLCVCENLDFLLWFLQHKNQIIHSDLVTCEMDLREEYLNEITVLKVQKRCKTILPFGITGTIVLTAIIFLTFYVANKRFHIIAKLDHFRFEAKWRFYWTIYRLQGYILFENETVGANVFLMYNYHDREVPEQINDYLQLQGIKVYNLYERLQDNLEISNFTECLNQSDCVLIVVTWKLAKSDTLDYELCIVRASNKRVLLYLIDDIPRNEIPTSLNYFYEKNCVIPKLNSKTESFIEIINAL